jgi:uncharacterized phage-associated protein
MLTTMRFHEAKATQAAARLLWRRGGQMSYTKLIKLLYLADRNALAQWGRPISTDTYVSMDRGPVLIHVLNRINERPSPTEPPSYWAQHITPIGNYEVKLTNDPDGQMLSEAEDDVLDGVYREYGHLSRWEIVELVHALPEWHDPNGSALPISYFDILNAQNKNPEEISAILDELNHLARVDQLFVTP